MPIRTLLVDDEPLARERLRSLLQTESDFQVVAECGSGKEALSWIRCNSVDLVFLDIVMPEMNGFEVVKALPSCPAVHIVFVTAFDTYAVQAFEIHAVDYVLKPVDPRRFTATLNHIRRRRTEACAPDITGPRNVAAAIDHSDQFQKAFLVKCDGEIVFMKPEDINWIESAGNYVTLHMEGRHRLIRETLLNMECRLATFGFAKISRSAVVNLAKITSMKTLRFGEYSIRLSGGIELRLKRGYRERFFRQIHPGLRAKI